MNPGIPGYYWWLDNESDEPNPANIQQVCQHVLYGSLERGVFYRGGFQTFLANVKRLLVMNPRPAAEILESYIKYFWNRQLVVQMTSVPIMIPYHVITVPLQRSSSALHIQADILYLRQQEKQLGFHFLLVVVEIYSRFVWMAAVKELKGPLIIRAFLKAFTRPGIAIDFYEYLQDKIDKVTVDGGSEFKRDFPTAIHEIFPNATLQISQAKHQTFERPGQTGPVEAANRMIRKVMRDFQIGVHTKFLMRGKNVDGLETILNTYNERGQAQTLMGLSPTHVVRALMEQDRQVLTRLDEHMAEAKQQKLEKKQAAEQQYPVIMDTRQGYAYRLKEERGAFPKEVDFRMSLQLYFITGYTTFVVDLESWDGTQRLKNISWKKLILVRLPLQVGPPIILQNLMKLTYDSKYTIPQPRQNNNHPHNRRQNPNPERLVRPERVRRQREVLDL
jgi:hypothetical protein